MICYEFKGGNGTASRQIDIRTSKDAPPRTFVVGVFLQANFGRRSQLVIAGVPVGKEIPGEVYQARERFVHRCRGDRCTTVA